MSNMFKIKIKDTKTISDASIYFTYFNIVIIADFGQINSDWV